MKCNKTILVDTDDELQETYTRLSADILKSKELRVALTLNIGKDRLFPQPWVVEVPVRRWDGGLLTRRMSSLMMSSSIYYQFHKMTKVALTSVFHRREANSQDPIPLNFHTNILSFFIIYLICILGSTVCLAMEFVKFIITNSLGSNLERRIARKFRAFIYCTHLYLQLTNIFVPITTKTCWLPKNCINRR